MENKLQDWIVSCFRVALLGEIYPSIRSIAVRYKNNKDLIIRYYLDREPTDFDYESIEVVATNLDSTSPSGLVKKLETECVFSDKEINSLDALDGFVYARREYDLELM